MNGAQPLLHYWIKVVFLQLFPTIGQFRSLVLLLFLIYANDVSEVFPDSCICKLYADDIKLYSAMKTVNDCKNLQESLSETPATDFWH